MEHIHVSPEVLEHARGAVIFDNAEWEARPTTTGYQCKLYRARLSLSSDSRHGVMRQENRQVWGKLALQA